MTVKGWKPNERYKKTMRGYYLLSHTDLRDEVLLIKDKLDKINLELSRLIKLIEKVK